MSTLIRYLFFFKHTQKKARTYIKAWVSLNFSQISSLTTELSALEHLKIIVSPDFLRKFYSDLFNASILPELA